ncbi:hypothetical protein D4764_15G0006840 [Takifugu flavidus]|uniref:Uncharacterized protein n=1 Tax=Takifugu flavidus TaxID=433684 RepID=A0A5C6P500_9TELE|nr:hypothetical protein D4764_15G0006840 [Takifugu flavidus]
MKDGRISTSFRSDVKTALSSATFINSSVVQGLGGIKGPSHPILPEHPPQDAPGDLVIGLFQVHKSHVDVLGKLPTPLKHPSKGKELIRGSTTGAKPALFLLDQRFDYRSDPLFQHPGKDFPREAEECDPPAVGTHPLVLTLKK